MVSDYGTITKYNEKGLGDDLSSRKNQVNMYSNPTHFIYEILQNSDDYGATTVSFQLLSDKLIIEHNGIPFNTENVKAISYFGESDDDSMKTGRFGLGFKSVFAFTGSPIIHSGDEHFEIYDLYRLRAVTTPCDLPEGHTRIILPFNHLELCPGYIERHVPSKDAFDKIAKRLRQLNKISLLFTQNIHEVRWTAGDKNGYYLREDLSQENEEYSNKFRKRKTKITDGQSPDDVYIVFSRNIRWCNSASGNEKKYKPVDIAFKLDEKNRVCKCKYPLVVLFATKIETHMGFLLNGPYRTTPSRETVSEEDEFNKYLVAETATLLAESLPKLKNIGLLDIDLLKTLPITTDDL